MFTTSDESPQSLPVNSTPQIQPQVNKGNSKVTTIQPPSGMDMYMYILIINT